VSSAATGSRRCVLCQAVATERMEGLRGQSKPHVLAPRQPPYKSLTASRNAVFTVFRGRENGRLAVVSID